MWSKFGSVRGNGTDVTPSRLYSAKVNILNKIYIAGDLCKSERAIKIQMFYDICFGVTQQLIKPIPVRHTQYLWDCLRTLYISCNEQSRCASRVHKCVRPLPSAEFPHAAALEPAGLPSWNKSRRHSRDAAAS